ncbi:GlxA family transcriptional regulator [Polyangium fumosum]|uniref:Helix-turn-helix domain-containing protein n=1 Tax=Polyangium fumosum TaxID=889272 RepID=A0A4U1IEJ8_9BACT|nr:DJ-1/PfpI family protein [Polyangium fumosum]TKC92124.1 helix-turn-helix domain-containing protein [Polyangium fumosum]
MVGSKGAAAIDIVGPMEVFNTATLVQAERVPGRPPAYRVELLSVDGGVIGSGQGPKLVADRSIADATSGIDTVLVAGGFDMDTAMRDARLLGWLSAMKPRVRRLGSVCAGALLLAAAGLLDGHHATTHWRAASRLAREFPAVEVEPDAIFVRSGDIYTSAGATAGMDLALALVEEDLGHEVALAAARLLVMFLKRPGGQSQFSQPLSAQIGLTGRLGDVVDWIVNHLSADLRVEALAARAWMSPRTFARVFAAEVGTTPAKFVETCRLEQARAHLEMGSATMNEVAHASGFGSEERMRRAFQRALRVTPEDYARRFSRRADRRGAPPGTESPHLASDRSLQHPGHDAKGIPPMGMGRGAP